METKIRYARPLEVIESFRPGNLYLILDETETQYVLEISEGVTGIYLKKYFEVIESVI